MNMNIIQLSGIVLLCLAAGGVIGFLIRKKIIESRIDAIEKYSKKILAEAQKEAKALKTEAALQAKDAVYQMKLDFEKETKERRHQFQIQEKRLFNKEESLDRKIDQLEKREGRISVRESSIDRIEKDLTNKQGEFEQVLAEQRRQLEKLAGISRDEAKQMLISSMEEEAKHDAAKLVRKIEAEAKEQSDRKAQEIKGKSDAEATEIYARAFGKDPDFYSFIQTLDIYKEAMGKDSSLILSTDSEFLKYFKGYEGRR